MTSVKSAKSRLVFTWLPKNEDQGHSFINKRNLRLCHLLLTVYAIKVQKPILRLGDSKNWKQIFFLVWTKLNKYTEIQFYNWGHEILLISPMKTMDMCFIFLKIAPIYTSSLLESVWLQLITMQTNSKPWSQGGVKALVLSLIETQNSEAHINSRVWSKVWSQPRLLRVGVD